MTPISRPQATILVVDDEPLNVDYLEQELEELNFHTLSASNGQEALKLALQQNPDIILLDIMMPVMDGFETLGFLKADTLTQNIPVIVISAMTDMDSIIKGIELGAVDYLAKPIEPALLQARLHTSLNEKRLRDLELEYLEQVNILTFAAEAIEIDKFSPETLDSVVARTDALGQLARVIQRLANEVHVREQRLREQLKQLEIDEQEARVARNEPFDSYLPMDRRFALLHSESIPQNSVGSVLLADITDFTPITESYVKEYGVKRGAEEITRLLNQLYEVLIEQVHLHGGSVIGFSGDAITCWFNYPHCITAVSCGLEMQKDVIKKMAVANPSAKPVNVSVKVSVVHGPVKRFLVGNPEHRVFELLSGKLINELNYLSSQTESDEVLVPKELADQHPSLIARSLRQDRNERCFVVVERLNQEVLLQPWQPLSKDALTAEQCKPWMLPEVFAQLSKYDKQFLTELRPVVTLFALFSGIDLESDQDAGTRLDTFVQWIQELCAQIWRFSN